VESNMMKENVMCTFCVINYEEKKNDNIIQDETHNIKRKKKWSHKKWFKTVRWILMWITTV